MRATIFVLLISCFCGCKSKIELKFRNFNGIEYVHCGDFHEGTIYIKNIEAYSINELTKFAYCYSGEYHFSGLTIISDCYAGPSFFTGITYGKVLYFFEFELVDISKSNKEVILRRIVIGAFQNYKNKLIDIPKDKFQLEYNCN